MSFLLGVDVGTTGTKTVLTDDDGNILSSAYKGYSIFNEDRDRIEQDAEDWWEAVVYTIRECIKDVSSEEQIVAISLSTQGGSMVPVDAGCRPLSKVAVWMDKRGTEQLGKLKCGKAEDFHYMRSGWRLNKGGNLIQIKWLQDNNIELFNSAYKFISTIEYINYKLTGRFTIDYTNAAMTHMFNIEEKCWDKEILEDLGIGEDRLPELVESGEVVGTLWKPASAELGLPEKVRVISGGHDQYCVALGAGAINENDMLLSTGTSWVVLGILDRLVFNTKTYFSPGYHVVKGKYGLMAAKSTGGISLEWYRKGLGLMERNCGDEAELESLRDVDKKAAAKGPGSGGVFFYTHFSGSGAPLWKTENKGSILGLDLSHDRYNVARAVMEGVVYDINLILAGYKESGMSLNNLKVVGGAAKSGLWMQIIADITGLSLLIPEFPDVACIGAAMLAGVGAGVFTSFEQACSRMVKKYKEVKPNKSNVEIYERIFKKYTDMLEHLSKCYSE